MSDRRDPRRLAAFTGLPDKPRDWYRISEIRNEVVGEQDGAEESKSTADVYVYDSIGGWSGVSADDFVRDVAGLDVDQLNLHLNSPGGLAFEGVAIANVLRQHRATVTVWVDGLAASAASVIAMAGDEVVMSPGSQLMVHDPSSIVIGQAVDMRKEAEVLDGLSRSIASVYAARAGGDVDEWRAVMAEETWYTADEAVAAGLADRVATAEDNGSASGEQIVPGSSSSFWDWWDSYGSPERHEDAVRALFAHAGRDDAPPPKMPGRSAGTQTPAATAGGSTHPQEDDDMSHLTEGLRQRLGFAEDADEATILAAVDEALAERAEPPKEPAALDIPEGMKLVSASVLDDLKAKAEQGVEARKQQQKERRESLVRAALADGRIRPADKDGWLKDLELDPERKEATLAALTPGLVPVDERGHDQAGAELGETFNQAEYDAFAASFGITPKGA